MVKETSCIIRSANELDAEAIASVHVLSWQKIYHGFIPDHVLKNLSISERKKQWNDLLKQGIQIFVAEINNKVVGFASICSFRDPDAERNQGEISAIYLHPDYWRRGIGKKLCQVAISELKTIELDETFIWVLIDNKQARLFYESLGFTNTNTTKTVEYSDGILLQETLYKNKSSNWF